MKPRKFLFLQGPITPFFRDLANALSNADCECFRINLCLGDKLFWRGRRSTDFKGTQQQWPAFIDSFYERHQITDVVLLGEQRFYHKVAIELAREKNIQVITTDFGYLRPDWITFERNGMSANSEFPKLPEDILRLAEHLPEPDLTQHFQDSFIRQVIWDMQYHLLSSLCKPLFPGYRSHQLHHPIWVYLGTGLRLLCSKLYRQRAAQKTIKGLLDAQDDYFVFPLQMQNDFQIRAYSKYAGIEEAIEEVVASFAGHAKPHQKLVIKIHPLDPGLMNWAKICKKAASRYGVESRVIFLDGGNLNQLLAGSRGVITINSTVGVWALRLAKPTHVLGQAIYDLPGLTSTVTLDEFWGVVQSPEPALLSAFMRVLASCYHIRGVYYNEPGLSSAVREAAYRLLHNRINRAVDQ